MTLLFLIVESQGNTEGFKMPRKPRRLIKMKQPVISEALKHHLLTGQYMNKEGEVEVLLLCCKTDALKNAWESCREEIMPEWIKKHPVTRPFGWWKFDGPRQQDQGSGAWFEGTLPEPRQRLGGIGRPASDVLAYVPCFDKGRPTRWISKEEEDGYNFEGVAIDPNNPPVFESVAVYLQRLDLLTPAEKVHLRKHPELMEPEKIEFEEDESRLKTP